MHLRVGTRCAYRLIAHTDAVHLSRALLGQALCDCAAKAADDVVLFCRHDLAGLGGGLHVKMRIADGVAVLLKGAT